MHSDQIAGVLESSRERILAGYVTALEAVGSSLLHDETKRTECLRQAESILDEIVSTLRREESPQKASAALSAKIGISRAADRVHPSESLRASVILFRCVIDTVVVELGDERVHPRLIAELSVTANAVISRRIRMAASSYAGHLLKHFDQAHTAERRRISRELHDRISANVAGAHRQVELFRLTAEKGEPRQQALDHAEQALKVALDDLRCIIADLRMAALGKGLEKSLEFYLKDIALRDSGYHISVSGDESRLSPELSSEAFLIIREAARNALAHSNAANLLIQINITPGELYAFVEDDGIGFSGSPEQPARQAGVSSMRERAELLGGNVVVSSQPGSGTRVELLIPLDQERPGAGTGGQPATQDDGRF